MAAWAARETVLTIGPGDRLPCPAVLDVPAEHEQRRLVESCPPLASVTRSASWRALAVATVVGHARQVTAEAQESAADVEPAVFEAARLRAVEATGLLDAATHEAWNGLTALAVRLLHAPMAFLTLVDDRRSYWLATDGVDRAVATENPVEESFCQYVIADRAPLVIEDATADERTCANPSVTGMGVRAWAGFPVVDADGQPLGSFCVMDVVPRAWTAMDVETLGVLARAASAQISLVSAVRTERTARAALDAVRAAEERAARQADGWHRASCGDPR